MKLLRKIIVRYLINKIKTVFINNNLFSINKVIMLKYEKKLLLYGLKNTIIINVYLSFYDGIEIVIKTEISEERERKEYF